MRRFITATGTEIGKTFVTEHLVRQLRAQGRRVRAIKPVHSGFDPQDPTSDAARLMAALDEPDVERVAPLRYAAPLSPDMAAAREGRAVDFAAAVAAVRDAEAEGSDDLLVEGIGGLMVPLTPHHTVLDLIEAVRYPVILVAGAYLGTLSHTLTAVITLTARRLPLDAIVLTETEEGPVPLEETQASLQPHLTTEARFVLVPHVADGDPVPDLVSALDDH